jgi:hypothetical protein
MITINSNRGDKVIKRKYFFSVKVAHNDNTGKYSWWNSILNTTCWKQDPNELLITVRELAAKELQSKLNREIKQSDIEVIALNRI